MTPGNRVIQYDSSLSVAMTFCSGWSSCGLLEHFQLYNSAFVILSLPRPVHGPEENFVEMVRLL